MANKLPDFNKLAAAIMEDVTGMASVLALNHFKGSFDKQGFTDTAFTPWPIRKNGDDGRALLVKTGNLRDSIRILQAAGGIVEIGTSDPKAKIHNEGGTIIVRITDKSRRFFWYMHKATGKSMWKALALTKKDFVSVYIPQRQFIGNSAVLMAEIDENTKTIIINELKKHIR